MKNIFAAADRLFLLLTAIALFQFCHVGMHWAVSAAISVSYFILLNGRYGALEEMVS